MVGYSNTSVGTRVARQKSGENDYSDFEWGTGNTGGGDGGPVVIPPFDQGVIHTDVHVAGDGTTNVATPVRVDTLAMGRVPTVNWIQQLGIGNYRLNNNINGNGFGIGVDELLTNNVHIQGRDPESTTVSTGTSANKAVLLLNSQDTQYYKYVGYLKLSPGANTDGGQIIAKISDTDRVILEHVHTDGLNEAGKKIGPGFRNTGSNELLYCFTLARNAGLHGHMLSKSGAAPTGYVHIVNGPLTPQEYRLFGSKSQNTRGSLFNYAQGAKIQCIGLFGYQNLGLNGGYFTYYGGVRIGNDCRDAIFVGCYMEAAYRNWRITDTNDSLFIGNISKDAAALSLLMAGKDQQCGGLMVVAHMGTNSGEIKNHGFGTGDGEGGGDAEGEDPSEGENDANNATSAQAMFNSGGVQRNNENHVFGFLRDHSNIRYRLGCSGVVVEAGSDLLYVLTNYKSGKGFNGTGRLRFPQGGLTENQNPGSMVYTDDLETVIGKALNRVSATLYAGNNGSGAVVSSADDAESSIHVLQLDRPSPITIGTPAEIANIGTAGAGTGIPSAVANPVRYRDTTKQFSYYTPGNGIITVTSGNVAFQGRLGRANTLASVVSTTEFVLDAGASAVDDYYNGLYVKIGTAGVDEQTVLITDYIGATKHIITTAVNPAFTGTPPYSILGSQFATDFGELPYTKILLFKKDTNKTYLGAIARGSVSGPAAEFIEAPSVSYEGEFWYSIEQKTRIGFQCGWGPTNNLFDFRSASFLGHSLGPVSMHPTVLHEWAYPEVDIEIPAGTYTDEVTIPFLLPSVFDGWRSVGVARWQVFVKADVAGDASNYVEVLLKRMRDGTLTTLTASILPVTNAALNGGRMVELAWNSQTGPVDITSEGNLFRVGKPFGSETASAIKDLAFLCIRGHGDGGYFPGGFLRSRWTPWINGVNS